MELLLVAAYPGRIGPRAFKPALTKSTQIRTPADLVLIAASRVRHGQVASCLHCHRFISVGLCFRATGADTRPGAHSVGWLGTGSKQAGAFQASPERRLGLHKASQA